MKSIYKGEPAPCLKCEKRFVGCHPQCDDYLKYSAERENDRKERQRKRAISEAAYYMSIKKHKR